MARQPRVRGGYGGLCCGRHHPEVRLGEGWGRGDALQSQLRGGRLPAPARGQPRGGGGAGGQLQRGAGVAHEDLGPRPGEGGQYGHGEAAGHKHPITVRCPVRDLVNKAYKIQKSENSK